MAVGEREPRPATRNQGTRSQPQNLHRMLGKISGPWVNHPVLSALRPTAPNSIAEVDASPSESLTLSSPSPPEQPPPGNRPSPVAKFQVAIDALVGSLSSLAGMALSLTRAQAPPSIAEQPEVTLGRPMLFVPGFQSKEGCFDHLTEKLTGQGANGGRVYYLDGNHIYLDAHCKERAPTVDSSARVFVLALGPNRDSPPIVAGILSRALEQISECSGEKVDVTGYSMGGLATRLYLDRGGKDIGKFMMVGTPNQGSPLADLGLGLLDQQAAGKSVGWLLSQSPKPLNPSDRSCLSWLTPTHKPNRNPALEDLNSRWQAQRTAVEEVEVVGSANLTTLRFDFRPGRGDGTVPVESLAPSAETPVVLLDDQAHARHGKLLESATLYQEMTRFFGWQPA